MEEFGGEIMRCNGKFLGYVLIIEKKVGSFHLWPLDQHQDALEEFAAKGAAVYPVYNALEENSLVEAFGPVWDIIADSFDLDIPFDEVFELGGRLGFNYLTSFEELSAALQGVPRWSDLLASRN